MASFIGAFFCHPDAHLGFLFAGATMGQGLSLPMMAVEVCLVMRGMRRPA
jgi:phosphatidylglycerol:prolipoprotein diacylglycerol transferase